MQVQLFDKTKEESHPSRGREPWEGLKLLICHYGTLFVAAVGRDCQVYVWELIVSTKKKPVTPLKSSMMTHLLYSSILICPV
jgi:hypothetical protein